MTLRSCRSDWHSVLDTFRRKVETLELTGGSRYISTIGEN